MTGGQMAPTTLNGQVTTTSKTGRNPQTQGYPIKVTEMLQHLDGVAYLERVSLTSAANAKKVKKAIKKAFEMQINQKGFSMIEVLSTCPVNWKMSPIEAMHWVDDEMSKVYPLGVFKDVTQDE